MTNSERICKEAGEKFFFKDHVFENLKNVFLTNNNRIELCDALFEYLNNYIVIQIKERDSASLDVVKEQQWMDRVVYEDAVNQINQSIKNIQNEIIYVNDCYNQKVLLDKSFNLLPVIIFLNPSISDYKRVIRDNGVINVFSLHDFNDMLNGLIHPSEFISYLNYRSSLFLCGNNLPDLITNENDNGIVFSSVKSEADIVANYQMQLFDGDKSKMIAAAKVAEIMQKFRSKILGKKDIEYKKIVSVLSVIKPEECIFFIDRYEASIEDAKNNKLTFRRFLQLTVDGKKNGLVFLSSGRDKLNNQNQYFLIMDSKKIQHQLDALLLIEFSITVDGTYDVDWRYDENKYVDDSQLKSFYEEAGFYNGSISRESLSFFADKMNN